MLDSAEDTRQRTIERKADVRQTAAIWYAFGVQDALRDHGIAESIDALAFGYFVRAEAEAYYAERVVSLDSVQEQFRRFTA